MTYDQTERGVGVIAPQPRYTPKEAPAHDVRAAFRVLQSEEAPECAEATHTEEKRDLHNAEERFLYNKNPTLSASHRLQAPREVPGQRETKQVLEQEQHRNLWKRWTCLGGD